MKKHNTLHWLKSQTVYLIILLYTATLPAYAIEIFVCYPKGKPKSYQDKRCRNDENTRAESISIEIQNSVKLGVPPAPADDGEGGQAVANNNSSNNANDNNENKEVPEGIANSENFAQGLKTIQQMRSNPNQRLNDIESAINQSIGK